jgi:hypothetical protein
MEYRVDCPQDENNPCPGVKGSFPVLRYLLEGTIQMVTEFKGEDYRPLFLIPHVIIIIKILM